MTAPRQILPGAVHLLTRRCSQRQFLLRPSEATNATFLYVLVTAAQRFGIQLHAYCVMSNHHHLVVSDPRAELPRFAQYLHALVARAMNASLGRWESFWAPSSYSAVALTSREDVIEKTAYVLANPVAAGLVPRSSQWPGLWSDPARAGGEPTTVKRPDGFFRQTGYMPEDVELRLTVPAHFDSPERFRREVQEALGELEEKHAAGRRAFVGASRVRAQSPWGRPADDEPRRGLKPRVAARDKWKRVEVLGRLAEFLEAYRSAWREWVSGVRDVIFPAGTYAMRVLHGASCAPSG